MAYIKVTDKVKKEICSGNDTVSFSDLSFWIHGCLGGCVLVATAFTGKKVTRKNWFEQSEFEHDWVVYNLLKSSCSGLGLKDREKLWRAVRIFIVKRYLEKMKSLDLTETEAKGINILIDRLGRLSLRSALGAFGASSKLREYIWEFRSKHNLNGWREFNNREQKIRRFLGNVSSATMAEEKYPKAPKWLNHLVVKLMRKAMRNVGLRPDATKIFKPAKPSTQTVLFPLSDYLAA
ncbi:hypothetical protein LCGC14_0702170 [marine sediment metagenome]|uniref:Uncharacterized protein n=1 Tax=marine sediment metagenome TaxID=412755 RepID=A0A0F9QHJ8_9ZZZZ